MKNLSGLEDTYELIEELGSGGGGTIFKAYHKRLQKYVVIKKMHDDVKDLLNKRIETDILKNLKHPYLPQVFDFLEINNSIYTVMDFIPGKSFYQLLKEKRKFSQKQIVKWARQLADALTYLHEQSPTIIHGDIKPANIMLTPSENICLIDFNISSFFENNGVIALGYSDGYSPLEQYPKEIKLTNSSNHQEQNILQDKYRNSHDIDKTEPYTRENNNLLTVTVPYTRSSSIEEDNIHNKGNDEYSPKNQFKNNAVINERSDIYSFGATMYHLLTGIKPSKATEETILFDEGIKEYSDGLVFVITKCLQSNPNKRFSSARDLLNALNHLNKLDKRYKKFMHKQEIAAISIIFLLAASVLCIYWGRQIIANEQKTIYESYISEMELCIENKQYNLIEAIYNKATKTLPNEFEANYMFILAKYYNGEYKEAITFAENKVFNKDISIKDKDIIGNCYFIVGNCAFEAEDYLLAERYFSKAISLNPNDCTYYRDYTITLARLGKLQQATEALDEAIDNNLLDDSIYEAKGELAYASGDYVEAEKNFLECIKLTDNDYIKMRSYLMCAKVYEEGSNIWPDNLIREIDLLCKSKEDLPVERNLFINSNLIKVYTLCAKQYGDIKYYQKAIDIIKEDRCLGRQNYNGDTNLAFLYRKIGDYSMALTTLRNMINDYGEDYRTYKRLAYLEIDIQNNKDNVNRNYNQFVYYYNKACQYYNNITEKNDEEMDYLDSAYEDLKKGKWLD